jgi:hypothetical protein
VLVSSDCLVRSLVFTPGEIAWIFGFAIACVLIVLWPLIRFLLPWQSRERRHDAVAAVLLAVLSFQCVFFMMKDAPTHDEPSHIASGYSYLVTGDFRMGPTQPPVARMLAALPLLLTKPAVNLDAESWREADEVTFAREFLFHSGNDADAVVSSARLPVVLLCVLLGFFVFRWARELYGLRAGHFSLALYAFSPSVLAYGRLATPVIPFACFAFASTYYFWRLLERPGLKNTLFSGVFLGLAFSSSYSGIAFAIAFIVAAVVQGARNTLRTFLGHCLAVLAIGAVIAFLSSGLTATTGENRDALEVEILERPVNDASTSESPGVSTPYRNQVSLPPLPRYLAGMVLNRSEAARARPVFIHGEWIPGGRWYCLPLAIALKEPLPLFVLIVLAIFVAAGRRIGHRLRARPRDTRRTPGSDFTASRSGELLLLAVPLVALVWSMFFARPYAGLKDFVFVVPFAYVLAGRVVASGAARPSLREWLRPGCLAALALLTWFCLESAVVSPHHLAYFNEAAGGPKGGVNWLVGSDLDWGQDLKRLRDYVERHKIHSLRLLYFGTVEPSYYGLAFNPLEPDDFLNLESPALFEEYAGERWAVSVTAYARLLKSVPWLKRIEGEEDARIGYSIFVFRPERLRSVLFPEAHLEASARPATASEL